MRTIIAILELGIGVMVLDLDVNPSPPSRDMAFLKQYDLVYSGDYSFMYTYSAPKPAVIGMWNRVLGEVRLCVMRGMGKCA